MQNTLDEYGKQKVVTLSRHLSWSHFLALIPLKSESARYFYGKLAQESMFGVRELQMQIERKVYERTENANIQLFKTKKPKQSPQLSKQPIDLFQQIP